MKIFIPGQPHRVYMPMTRRLIGGPYRLPRHLCKNGDMVNGATTHFDPVSGDVVRKCRVCKQRFNAYVTLINERDRNLGEFEIYKAVWFEPKEVAQ